MPETYSAIAKEWPYSLPHSEREILNALERDRDSLVLIDAAALAIESAKKGDKQVEKTLNYLRCLRECLERVQDRQHLGLLRDFFDERNLALGFMVAVAPSKKASHVCFVCRCDDGLHSEALLLRLFWYGNGLAAAPLAVPDDAYGVVKRPLCKLPLSSDLRKAISFLLVLLCGEPLKKTIVRERADAAGISNSTLRNAIKALAVKPCPVSPRKLELPQPKQLAPTLLTLSKAK